MKNVFLLVHDDPGQEARFQAALDLTRALDGRLTCVDVAQMPSLIGDYYDTAGQVMLLEQEWDRGSENHARLDARLAREGVSWNWIKLTGDMAECISSVAALADLIVVNRRLDAAPGPDMRDIAGTLAMRTQKPVVAVPDDLRRFDVGGRALIAWDGSRSVTATMRACVPLLALCCSVEIFTVDDGSEQTPAHEAAIYLSRHGIHATIRRLKDKEHDPDALIFEECEARGATWCLMGAYGHGRVVEALLGGTTRRMLGSSPLPLVLGH